MSEIKEFFSGLFNPDSWPARWHCGNWSSFHGWLYIVSSIAIAAAYFSIPLILYVLIRRSASKLPFQRIFWLFILFIFACGFTHIMDAVMFWFPVYRVSAIVLFITALASLAALVGLLKIVPQALTLKSPAALQKIINERTEELEKSNAYLHKANEGLQKANNESQLLIKQKDDFLSIASHELRTPITSLKVLSQMLHEKFTNENHDISVIGKMNAQIEKLTLLVNDVLQTTNLQSSGLEYKMQHFKLNELIVAECDEVQKVTTSHQLVIKQNDPAQVCADKGRIAQVLINLFTNAIKYSPKGGEIEISSKVENNTITCTVRDFGIGIPEEQLSRIFERFYRVSGQNRETYPGLGLGLYIAKDIITRHKGTIGVNSANCMGSSFYFSLPLA